MNIQTLNSIKALDGRNFAMLKADELVTLNFYLAQGRKYDVEITIMSDADQSELARAPSKQQADEIMRRANSHVYVNVGHNAEAAWAERNN
jgi:hypothetical protein